MPIARTVFDEALKDNIVRVYRKVLDFLNPEARTIIAVLLGAAVLNERLEPAVYGGSILVLAGILLANAKAFYARLRPTA